MKSFYLMPAILIAAACSSSQKTAVEAFVAANNAKIQTVCADVLAIANSPITSAVGLAVPQVASAASLAHSGCDTAEAIASMAQSASSVDWLNTLKTTMATKGAVVPAPVAPVLVN